MVLIRSKTILQRCTVASITDSIKDREKKEANAICTKISLAIQNTEPPKINSPRMNFDIITI